MKLALVTCNPDTIYRTTGQCGKHVGRMKVRHLAPHRYVVVVYGQDGGIVWRGERPHAFGCPSDPCPVCAEHNQAAMKVAARR